MSRLSTVTLSNSQQLSVTRFEQPDELRRQPRPWPGPGSSVGQCWAWTGAECCSVLHRLSSPELRCRVMQSWPCPSLVSADNFICDPVLNELMCRSSDAGECWNWEWNCDAGTRLGARCPCLGCPSCCPHLTVTLFLDLSHPNCPPTHQGLS